MEILKELGYFNEEYTYLDFGCGNGDDLKALSELNINILGYDKYNECFNVDLKGITFNMITANYVFNVIKGLNEHKDVLEHIKRLSKDIYICVRSDFKAIKDSWEYLVEDDCWRTSTGSYQRFYDDDMVDKYFGEVKYIIKNNSLKLFKLL